MDKRARELFEIPLSPSSLEIFRQKVVQTNGNDPRNSNMILIFRKSDFLKKYIQKFENWVEKIEKYFFQKRTKDTQKRAQSTDLVEKIFLIF